MIIISNIKYMNKFKTIIIGAGPAGLFAAIHAAQAGGKILLLEKMSSPGKKLLMSGSGRCNLTSGIDIHEFFKRYGSGERFIKPALLEFGNEQLLDFFRERDIEFYKDKNSKVFPKSEHAVDILNVLIDECARSNVDLRCESPVKSIAVCDEGFNVICKSEEYICEKLIITTGGKSYPTTGSTGEMFYIIEKLGHKIEPLSPALTAVLILDYPFAGIEGVSVPDARITVIRDGKKQRSHTGDILFTFKGLSGPGILDFSRDFLPEDQLNISFIGDINEEAFRLQFIETIAKSAGKTMKNLMRAFGLPQSLNEKLLKLNGIPNDRKAAELNKKDRIKLLKSLSAFTLTVRELEGYNRAMTTRGGVSLKEVNPKTMESRIVPGLFFAGEVLDVDGDTGGFNLQAAFSTGRMAGRNV